MDTTLITLVITTVGTVVGWFFGKSKRKAEDANALLASMDTQGTALMKQNEIIEQLAEKYATSMAEKADLQERALTQERELKRLRREQQKLQGEVEGLREQLKRVLEELSVMRSSSKPCD